MPTLLAKRESYEERQQRRNEEIEHQERESWNHLRQDKKNNLQAYIKACGIPKIFQNKEHSGCNETQSLFLTGSHGTGKTYKAVGILENFVKSLPCPCFKDSQPANHPIFITVPELLLKIRSCFSDPTSSEEYMLKPYIQTPLLILDDIGVEKTTEWALQSLYIIINNRYSEEKQTIITSNLTLDEVREKVGDRIASRISGMCKIVKFTGKDKRLTIKP